MMHIFGKLTGLIPKELIHNIGDAHVYLNHEDPLKRQIGRTPRPFPILEINREVNPDKTKIEDFQASDFKIKGYFPYPGIKMDMAV